MTLSPLMHNDRWWCKENSFFGTKPEPYKILFLDLCSEKGGLGPPQTQKAEFIIVLSLPYTLLENLTDEAFA